MGPFNQLVLDAYWWCYNYTPNINQSRSRPWNGAFPQMFYHKNVLYLNFTFSHPTGSGLSSGTQTSWYNYNGWYVRLYKSVWIYCKGHSNVGRKGTKAFTRSNGFCHEAIILRLNYGGFPRDDWRFKQWASTRSKSKSVHSFFIIPSTIIKPSWRKP